MAQAWPQLAQLWAVSRPVQLLAAAADLPRQVQLLAAIAFPRQVQRAEAWGLLV